MKRRSIVLATASIFAVIVGFAVMAIAQDLKMVTTDELKGMLGSPDFVIVDVRSSHDWDSSDSKIQDAVREDPGKLSAWMEKYAKDKKLVFYCA